MPPETLIERARTGMRDGRVVAVLAALIGAAVVYAGSRASLAFVPLAIVALALAAYGAFRWPLPTLGIVSIATLADADLTPRLLASSLGQGPIGISEPLLAVTGLAVAARAIRSGSFRRALRDPVLPLVAVFVELALLSAFVNRTPMVVAILGIVMTIDAIAAYFVVRMVALDPKGGERTIAAVVAVVGVAALFGIAQLILDPDLLGFHSVVGQFGEGARITSFLGNPNMVAAVIGLVVPFALYGSRHLRDARWRWVGRATLFVLLWALILTFSRGAWLAVGLGSMIGAALLDWRSLPVLALTLALAWGATSVMPRSLLVPGHEGANSEWPPPLLDSTADRIGHLGEAADTRAMFLRDGLVVVSDHLLLGVGPGRYGGAAASIIPTPVYEQYGTTLAGYRTVHNFWLHLLGESGALGTAVFLTMIVGLVIRFGRRARAATGPRFVVLAGAATMLLVASLNSVTEMIFEGNMPVILVWLIVGIASMVAPVQSLRPAHGGARAV